MERAILTVDSTTPRDKVLGKGERKLNTGIRPSTYLSDCGTNMTSSCLLHVFTGTDWTLEPLTKLTLSPLSCFLQAVLSFYSYDETP